MPTYEYICKSCKHEFEEFQSMSAPSLRKCPKCKQSALERKIGLGGGIIFKGGGFYETDYRSDSYKKAADADTKAASGKSDDAKTGHTNTDDKKPAEQSASASAPPKEEPKTTSSARVSATKRRAPAKAATKKRD